MKITPRKKINKKFSKNVNTEQHTKSEQNSTNANDKKDSAKETKNNKVSFLSKIFNKIKIKNISVVTLVYYGFGILTLTIIVAGISVFYTLHDLKGAFNVVTEKATPFVLKADKMEANLISAHRGLLDILNSKTIDEIDKYSSIYKTDRENSAITAKELLVLSKNTNINKQEFDELTQLFESYMEKTSSIPLKYRQWILDNEKSTKEISSYRAMVNLFAEEYSNEKQMAHEEDEFVYQEMKDADTTKGPLVINTDNALSSSDLALIKSLYQKNKGLSEIYAQKIKNLERDWAEFENDLGRYYKFFLANVYGDKGVLAVHMDLIEQQVALKKTSDEAVQILENLRSKLVQISNLSNEEMKKSVDSAYGVIENSYIEFSIVMIIGLIISITVATTVGRVIRIPLQRIVNSINAMCEGDMTQKVNYEAKSELGMLSNKINQLIDVFRHILSQIASASNTLKDSAHGNSESMKLTSEKTQAQMEETSLIATSIYALMEASNSVAKSAEISLNEILGVNNAAERGRRIMSDNITTNHSLAAKLNLTSKSVTKVSDMSDNIGQIVEVIRGIAEQTNLLALNAAIESARAGEHGRGFAVVADEVRNLAQKTADSTKNVNELIDGLQQQVKDAVGTIKDCVSEMERSVMQTSEVNSAIEEIKAILTIISDMAHQIASAAEQQRCTTNEINGNIEKITSLSEENSIEINKANDDCVRLDQLAADQKHLVDRFKL